MLGKMCLDKKIKKEIIIKKKIYQAYCCLKTGKVDKWIFFQPLRIARGRNREEKGMKHDLLPTQRACITTLT